MAVSAQGRLGLRHHGVGLHRDRHLALRRDAWRQVAGPARAVFRASAVSRRDIWAIAATSRADYVLHFNGSAWRRVRAGRLFNGVQLHDILAVSDAERVGGRHHDKQSGATSLVLAHWDGHGWTRVLTRRGALAGNLAAGRNGAVLLTATPTEPGRGWPGHPGLARGCCRRRSRPVSARAAASATWRCPRAALTSGLAGGILTRPAATPRSGLARWRTPSAHAGSTTT